MPIKISQLQDISGSLGGDDLIEVSHKNIGGCSYISSKATMNHVACFITASCMVGLTLTTYGQILGLNPYSSSFIKMEYVNGMLISVDPYENILVATGSDSSYPYKNILNPQGTINIYPSFYSIIGHNCINMTRLNAGGNRTLQTLDISGSINLDYLDCSCIPQSRYGSLPYLDLSTCKSLTWLECHDNALVTLILPNSSLTNLNCYDNQLTSIILPPNSTSSLIQFNCFGNNISELDVSSYIALTQFACMNNQLSGSLDLSNNINLNAVDCSNNALTEIILPNYQWFNYFRCDNNQLTKLTLPLTASINSFSCTNNQLDQESIDGILASLVRYGISGNADLSGGTNAAPSSVGSASIAILLDNQWGVTTN